MARPGGAGTDCQLDPALPLLQRLPPAASQSWLESAARAVIAPLMPAGGVTEAPAGDTRVPCCVPIHGELAGAEASASAVTLAGASATGAQVAPPSSEWKRTPAGADTAKMDAALRGSRAIARQASPGSRVVQAPEASAAATTPPPSRPAAMAPSGANRTAVMAALDSPRLALARAPPEGMFQRPPSLPSQTMPVEPSTRTACWRRWVEAPWVRL